MDKHDKGFTLAELLISVAIFALTFLIAAFAMSTANQLAQESRGRLLALNTARSILETVKNTALANIGNIDEQDFVPANLPNGSATIDTAAINANLSTVTVTVTWTGFKGIPKTLQLTTRRSAF